ncbi:MAG: DUF6789 family protein [Gemmatimonadales bacterium]
MADAVARRTEVQLRWTAAVAALVGLGALVAQVLGLLPMAFFLTVLGAPSVVLLFVIAAHARRINARTFLRMLRLGIVAGVLATFAYDGSRWLMTSAGIFDYNGFVAIYIFGGWITGSDPSTPASAVAGWTYHFWNGISFGIFYAMLFGGRHWLIGVAYGMLMEAMMLGLFPLFLRVTNKADFIALSLIGHVFYGGVLGSIVERHGMSWAVPSKSGGPP